ncbi:MAG: hypothetical protein ACLUOI_29670 [Eisenbergiella sp.]
MIWAKSLTAIFLPPCCGSGWEDNQSRIDQQTVIPSGGTGPQPIASLWQEYEDGEQQKQSG